MILMNTSEPSITEPRRVHSLRMSRHGGVFYLPLVCRVLHVAVDPADNGSGAGWINLWYETETGEQDFIPVALIVVLDGQRVDPPSLYVGTAVFADKDHETVAWHLYQVTAA